MDFDLDQAIDTITPDEEASTDETAVPETETVDNPPSGDVEPEPEQLPEDDIKAQLSRYENETAGLRKAIAEQRAAKQAERERVQSLENKLNQITQALQEAMDKKVPQEQKPSRIPIEYDEEGNPVITADLISKLVPKDDAIHDEIKTLKDALATVLQEKQRESITSAREKNLARILAENEGFPTALQNIDEQFRFLNSGIVDAYLERNGLENPKTAEEAIGIILASKELVDAFEKKFPGADIESTLEAKLIPSQRVLRRALRLNTPRQKPASSHTPLPDKPAPFTKAAGMNTQEPADVVSQVAELSFTDFLELSDDEVAKVMKIAKSR